MSEITQKWSADPTAVTSALEKMQRDYDKLRGHIERTNAAGVDGSRRVAAATTQVGAAQNQVNSLLATGAQQVFGFVNSLVGYERVLGAISAEIEADKARMAEIASREGATIETLASTLAKSGDLKRMDEVDKALGQGGELTRAQMLELFSGLNEATPGVSLAGCRSPAWPKPPPCRAARWRSCRSSASSSALSPACGPTRRPRTWSTRRSCCGSSRSTPPR